VTGGFQAKLALMTDRSYALAENRLKPVLARGTFNRADLQPSGDGVAVIWIHAPATHQIPVQQRAPFSSFGDNRRKCAKHQATDRLTKIFLKLTWLLVGFAESDHDADDADRVRGRPGIWSRCARRDRPRSRALVQYSDLLLCGMSVAVLWGARASRSRQQYVPIEKDSAGIQIRE